MFQGNYRYHNSLCRTIAELFPVEAKIVRRLFYKDCQVEELLSRGHFPIRKWFSNDSAALEGESECDKEHLIKYYDGSDIAKA